MELIFNARQLSRCPELPAGHGNYACWQKSTASSSEQRRNSRIQDGKTLEGLQARPDPVYEPMSVSLIFRLRQKESRWTPAAGIQRDSSLPIFQRSSVFTRWPVYFYVFTRSAVRHRWLRQFGLPHPHKERLHDPLPYLHKSDLPWRVSHHETPDSLEQDRNKR